MTTDDEELKPKSKQQQKREAEAVQALGAELVELPAPQIKELFDKLELPDKLREALLECRSIKSRKARRRQLQYIGKLMRDFEVAPIRLLLAEFKRGGRAATAQQHHIERWRERLLTEGDKAFNELLRLHPEVNAQHVQQLIASALKQSAEKKVKKKLEKKLEKKFGDTFKGLLQ